MLVSLLARATPEEVRMILIDPKMVEPHLYEGISAPDHLIDAAEEGGRAGAWLAEEMEQRYQDMHSQCATSTISTRRA